MPSSALGTRGVRTWTGNPQGVGEARAGGRALLQEVASLQGLVLISHKIREDPTTLLCIQTFQKKERKTTAGSISPAERFQLREKLNF